MDDLLAEFIAETREMMDALQGEIIAWETDPADRARLDSIFRFVHTVKGNCGFFDFPRLAALSHAAEDALADVRSGQRKPDSALVDAVLAIIDRVAEMVAEIESGRDIEEGDDTYLIEALEPGGAVALTEEGESAIVLAPEGVRNPATVAMPRSVRVPIELMDNLMSSVSDMARAAGCDQMQGWLYFKAIPAGEVTRHLALENTNNRKAGASRAAGGRL